MLVADERMIQSPLIEEGACAILERITPEQVVRRWHDTHGIDVSGELAGIDSLLLCECRHTGLQFFLPPRAAGPAQFYARLQQLPWYYMPERWEHGAALRDLRGRRRVLEVGCGTGSFVRRCAAAGHDCLGIDMNADAVTVARNAGAHVEALSLEELAARGDEPFDAVCSFQVLEHVPAPRSFLEGLVRLTAPGGLLILCVPNRESFIRHERMPLDMPPHHMTRWSEGTFRRTAELFGLRTVAIRFEPLPKEHVPWFVGVQVREVRKARRFSKLYANRATATLAVALLNAGLRRFVRGHTLYGVFERPRHSGVSTP